MLLVTVYQTETEYTLRPRCRGARIVALPKPLPANFAGLSDDTCEAIVACKRYEKIDLPYSDVLKLQKLLPPFQPRSSK